MIDSYPNGTTRPTAGRHSAVTGHGRVMGNSRANHGQHQAQDNPENAGNPANGRASYWSG